MGKAAPGWLEHPGCAAGDTLLLARQEQGDKHTLQILCSTCLPPLGPVVWVLWGTLHLLLSRRDRGSPDPGFALPVSYQQVLMLLDQVLHAFLVATCSRG